MPNKQVIYNIIILMFKYIDFIIYRLDIIIYFFLENDSLALLAIKWILLLKKEYYSNLLLAIATLENNHPQKEFLLFYSLSNLFS